MVPSSSDRSETPGLVLRSHTGAAYRFDPGALSLELLPTGGPGAFRRYEWLHTPVDLAAWAGRSRLVPTPVLRITEDELTAARAVRDALWRIVVARTEGTPGAPDDVRLLNEAAALPPLAPAIGTDGARAWAGPGSGAQLLSTVARDAVDLLTGPHAQRIRTCAAADCQLVYVDASRPGRRRWCSMEHCGNRHKVRTLRARRAEEEGS
ncbi:CGNR zinc finger domain-containing protein [Streptomyces colonosanans]|uniref:Zf-CGNR multi-domain protein n=1 Tax=Streptomyces colonosanans TaxID=1428652 RepID=A0A1S2PB22_9ACTN|nr:ABATE domain-containing protein [Streptomyces colonosanans]OIJ90951.1 zf-CGNR multi-domain protein [Streptomyces colonosanans]